MRSEEGLILLSSDGTILWTNEAAAALLQFSREDLKCMALPLLASPTSASPAPAGPVAHAFQSILARERDQAEGEARFASKSQRRIAVHWKLWVLPSPGPEMQVLLSLSETAQASAEGPITSSYRDVFEHAVEGIFRTTIDGRFLEVNPALARIYGYATPAELMEAIGDLRTQVYVNPGRREEFVRCITEQGFVSDFESEVRTADGGVIWTAEFARVVNDSSGQPLYFEGSVIDITERKRSETALRESEEKFRQLAEMTSVVPWEADLRTGRFTYVGPQAVQLLGYPTEEWLQDEFWEAHVHQEDRGWVSIVRAEAISKRQNFECEYRMLSAAQQVVWVREIVGILSDHDDLQAIGGFMLDVSYRKEAEESLRESQHFIEQIASASPTISYLYDPVRQQSVYVNGRVPDILGYSPQALAEMQPFFALSLAHPDEIAAHEEHFASLTEAPPDVVVGREFRLRSAGGAWVWLYSRECVFKRDAEGRAIRVVGTLEDITVHRHTVEELEANETLFRRLAETTRVVPFDFNPAASRFTYIGPQAESLLGYPLDQCYHLGSWIEMLHPDDVFEGTRFATEAVSAAPRDFQTEFRLRSASGRLIWFRQIVHCSSEDDERTHVRGFLLDVTESKRIEEERERSKTELRELAARSHKVREEERMNIAREIHDELGQALTLFKLDLAWMSARVHKVVPEPDLQPLAEKISSMEQMIASTLQTVRRVLSALRPPLLDEFGLADAVEWYATDFARRATLRCDLNVEPVDAVPIEAALAVFRIFQEITTNIARHARASRVQVDLRIRGPYVVLVVTDNGRGMSEQDQTKKGHYGLLGMRERAWAFGGQVWVESVPGKGTTVRVEMPFGAAPQALPSSSTEAA